MFFDPTGTIDVGLPPSWALDPISSSLTDLVFTNWVSPEDRQVSVRVVRVHATPGVSDDAWDRAVRDVVSDDATRVEARPGPVILVERPGGDHRPDQRWAIVRGPRLDAVIEQVGVPLGGALLTPELEEALRTLHVPANVYLPPLREQAEWSAAMDAAERAFQAGDANEAAVYLAEARAIAKDTWLHSLTGLTIPEIPAVVAEAEAALALTRVTGSALFLHQATDTLLRVRRSLSVSDAPSPDMHADRVDRLFIEAMRMHAEMGGHDAPPANALAAVLIRCRLIVHQITTVLQSDTPSMGDPWVALAVEVAATAVALARRVEISGGAAEQATALRAIEVGALDHLVSAGALLQAGNALAGRDARRAATESWLLAARQLAALAPSVDRDRGLVLALGGHAGSLLALGDEPSLEEADRLLTEAQAELDELVASGQGDMPDLQAQVALQRAWLRHNRRQVDDSLEILDRGLHAARRAGLARIERALRSLRSQVLVQLGRHEEAVHEAVATVGAADDDAETSHRLNLAVALKAAGRPEEALRQVRAGLAAAIPGEVLGPIVLRLLYVAAALIDPFDAAASLAVTETAELVLDVHRLGISEAADRVSFDDAIHHREIAGSLVQRRLAVGDFPGALATADRHRARSLVPASGLQLGPGDLDPALDAVPMPAADAPLTDQIPYVAAVAIATLTKAGLPAPLPGEVLMDAVTTSGKATVVLHPTGDELIALVVRPNPRPTVTPVVAQAPLSEILDLTDALRRQLGIVVAGRAARGELPAPPLDELLAALVDDDVDAGDAELDRLRRALHDALLSEVLSLLEDGEPLVVVPYRELAVIPLSVLTDAQGQALGERHPLSMLPSIASLQSMVSSSPRPPVAVVVGDPDVGPEHGLSSLPGAAEEARWVATALTDAGIVTARLFGTAATEAALREKAYNARLVHLACHAALREPASSSPLFLSPAPPDDGLLLPAEVAELMLDGALAVMAACESGLGRTTADGVLGLGHAFLRAGARSIVLSLWRVSDAATNDLMRHLYTGLLGDAPDLDGGLDIAAALARAQTLTRQNVVEHPSGWGPWLVVGDGGWRLA